MNPGQSPAKNKNMEGSGGIPIYILRDTIHQYEFKYEIMSGYLNVVHFEFGKRYGRRNWDRVGVSRNKDVSQVQQLMEKIKKQGDGWSLVKPKDCDILIYEQRDKKGTRTGNYKLLTKEYKTSKRIERYYMIEELRHEI